jgi:TPR repeat protein
MTRSSFFLLLVLAGLLVDVGRVHPLWAAENTSEITKLKQKCDRGDAEWCFSLGWMYAIGRVVRQDFSQAAALFRTACDKGNADGCRHLGRLYAKGEGVQQDAVQAAALYHKVCEKGDGEQCWTLGQMYELDGVMKDLAQAAGFYRTACDKSDVTSCNHLGWMYEWGKGVRQSHDGALSYYGKACEMKLEVGCKNYVRLKTGKE